MKIKSISELLEIYDFLKENCRSDPLIKETKILRRYLEQAAVIQAIHLIRKGKRILGVAFFWPTNELPKEEELPQFDPEGEILWAQYCYSADKVRGKGKVMAIFLEEGRLEYPQVKALAYRRTKKDGKLFVWNLKVQKRELEKA